MTPTPGYHVLIKQGDASAEVEAALVRLGSPADAGLHRYFFVSRADQTVVMAAAPDAPLAALLRAGRGWSEPSNVAE